MFSFIIQAMSVVLATSLPQLPPPRVGKVREVYDLGDQLLIVATDRISAFDVIMANGIPDKGKILTQLSSFWFDLLRDLVPNHVLSTSDAEISSLIGTDELRGRSMLARKARPLPIECVARGYITGSLFKEYRGLGGGVHELGLPEGLVDADRLPEPIFTPATKAEEGHDENLSFSKAVDLVGRETAEFVREKTLELYGKATEYAAQKGLLLADTKFEFGETADGVIWIDEALTPDSSRYWEASLYAPGGAQPSYDKQFVRDYLETLAWNKQPPGPTLPDEVVVKTRAKYVEAYERLTGREFL